MDNLQQSCIQLQGFKQYNLVKLGFATDCVFDIPNKHLTRIINQQNVPIIGWSRR